MISPSDSYPNNNCPINIIVLERIMWGALKGDGNMSFSFKLHTMAITICHEIWKKEMRTYTGIAEKVVWHMQELCISSS